MRVRAARGLWRSSGYISNVSTAAAPVTFLNGLTRARRADRLNLLHRFAVDKDLRLLSQRSSDWDLANSALLILKSTPPELICVRILCLLWEACATRARGHNRAARLAMHVQPSATCNRCTLDSGTAHRGLVQTTLSRRKYCLHFVRNDSINNVGSQARVDFGGANQPNGSEERSQAYPLGWLYNSETG